MAKGNNTVSIAEAAKNIGISNQRVRQLIRDKKLKASRNGKHWNIGAADLYNFRRARDARRKELAARKENGAAKPARATRAKKKAAAEPAAV